MKAMILKGPEFLGLSISEINTLSSIIVAVACFFVFFKTRELYNLSQHEGIKYFRYVFLFFGISFLGRLVVPFIVMYTDLSLFFAKDLAILIMVYTGTMAILCLLYSVLWKKFRLENAFGILTLISLVLAFLTVLGIFRDIILLLQILLFWAALFITVFVAGKKKKLHFELYLLYFMLFASWIGNIFAQFTRALSFEAHVILNLVSVVLFVLLLFRVWKSVKT